MSMIAPVIGVSFPVPCYAGIIHGNKTRRNPWIPMVDMRG